MFPSEKEVLQWSKQLIYLNSSVWTPATTQVVVGLRCHKKQILRTHVSNSRNRSNLTKWNKGNWCFLYHTIHLTFQLWIKKNTFQSSFLPPLYMVVLTVTSVKSIKETPAFKMTAVNQNCLLRGLRYSYLTGILGLAEYMDDKWYNHMEFRPWWLLCATSEMQEKHKGICRDALQIMSHR